MTNARQRERKKRQAKLQRDYSDLVRILDAAFHAFAKDKASQTGLSIEEMVEESWNLFERGFLRLASGGVEPCDGAERRVQAKKNRPVAEWRRALRRSDAGLQQGAIPVAEAPSTLP